MAVTEEAPRLTVSVEAAARMLGVSRSTAYELARKNQLPGALRLGNRVVVSQRALERVLDRETERREES